jgi:hypothetical protein
MSNINAALGVIRAARASLQKFRLKLLHPSAAALESGSADLLFAVESLERLEPVLRSQGPRPVALEQALRLEVAGLRENCNRRLHCSKAQAAFIKAGRGCWAARRMKELKTTRPMASPALYFTTRGMR